MQVDRLEYNMQLWKIFQSRQMFLEEYNEFPRRRSVILQEGLALAVFLTRVSDWKTNFTLLIAHIKGKLTSLQ